MITRTHNAYHLGDNLVHLNFLRKVALANPDRQFVHAAQWQYIRQLKDVVADVPNLSLTEYGYLTPSDSIDSWRGAGGFWYRSEIRNDFVNFHLREWFPHLCDRMEVENPMRTAKDMLFDYPQLGNLESNRLYPSCEVLCVNSAPGSGQLPSFDQYRMAQLANDISRQGHSIIATDDTHTNPSVISAPLLRYSVTNIGQISLHCHTIVMVSTGPSWPTFNVWNQDTIMHRIILLEPERVNLAPNTIHCATVDEASEVLKSIGLL